MPSPQQAVPRAALRAGMRAGMRARKALTGGTAAGSMPAAARLSVQLPLGAWIGVGVGAGFLLMVVILCCVWQCRRGCMSHKRRKEKMLKRNESDHFVWRRGRDKGGAPLTTAAHAPKGGGDLEGGDALAGIEAESHGQVESEHDLSHDGAEMAHGAHEDRPQQAQP